MIFPQIMRRNRLVSKLWTSFFTPFGFIVLIPQGRQIEVYSDLSKFPQIIGVGFKIRPTERNLSIGLVDMPYRIAVLRDVLRSSDGMSLIIEIARQSVAETNWIVAV